MRAVLLIQIFLCVFFGMSHGQIPSSVKWSKNLSTICIRDYGIDAKGNKVVISTNGNGSQLVNNKKVFFLNSRGKLNSKFEKDITAYHFSRKGFLYSQINDQVQVRNMFGGIQPYELTTNDLKKLGIRSLRNMFSSLDHVYFKVKGAIVKIPLKNDYQLDIKSANKIPLLKGSNYPVIGVDDQGQLFGAKKLAGKEIPPGTKKKLSEFYVGIFKIEEDGSSKFLNGFVAYRNHDNSGEVSILPDGRILGRKNADEVVLVDGNTGTVEEVGKCKGCQFLGKKTSLDQFGNLISPGTGYSCEEFITISLIKTDTPEELVQAAEMSIQAGQRKLAYEYAWQAIEKNPRMADAFYFRAISRPGFSLQASAGVDLSKSESPELLILGMIYNQEVSKQEFNRSQAEQKTITDLKYAITQQSNYSNQARYFLGQIYLTKKNPGIAYDYLEKAFQSGYDEPFVLDLLTEAAILTRKLGQAQTYVDLYKQNDAKNHQSYFLQGAIHYIQKDYFAALEAFEQAFKLRRTAFNMYHVGLALAALGKKEDACSKLSLAVDKGIREGHHYVYMNCDYPGEKVNCSTCGGDGLVFCASCDPRINPGKSKACSQCNGNGYLLAPPEVRKLTLLLR